MFGIAGTVELGTICPGTGTWNRLQDGRVIIWDVSRSIWNKHLRCVGEDSSSSKALRGLTWRCTPACYAAVAANRKTIHKAGI